MGEFRWPRQYAAAYFDAGDDKEKQRLALVGCPIEFRELVRAHIKIMLHRSKNK